MSAKLIAEIFLGILLCSLIAVGIPMFVCWVLQLMGL